MSDNYNRIHFIGIGGISMSGLAELMLDEGHRVSGSDRVRSHITEKLSSMGAYILYGHSGSNIPSDTDLVVYTSAIAADNDELVRAREMNITLMDRAQFLGYVMKNYDNAICVSGTHGKTTTTGMAASVLVETDMSPTVFLGGEMDSMGGNLLRGQNRLMLTEACEYRRNFLKFSPTAEIILNIDEDHLDYYKDLKDIQNAFVEFAGLLPHDGALVVNCKDACLFKDMGCHVATFGLDKSADYYPDGLSLYPAPSFDLMHRGKKIVRINLNVLGMHNVLNATSVAALCMHYGIAPETIARGLAKFKGTNRRYQYKGTYDGVVLIDDYAHHPTEMITTLETARTYTKGKIITVFQPHTYSRTKALLNEFANALRLSDMTILLDIYAAREINDGSVSSQNLLAAMTKANVKGQYAKDFACAAELVREIAKPGDTVITMGAGNVYEVIEMLLEARPELAAY